MAKNKKLFKNIDELIAKTGKKYIVRIGILNPNASRKHEDTKLTMAELGAVHEFGATINRGKTTIIIPTRSFLRMPLLSKEGIKAIMTKFKKAYEKAEIYFTKRKKVSQELEEYENYFQERYIKGFLKQIDAESLINIFAGILLSRVQEAFIKGGFGKWAPITEATKKHRKGSPDNPPLDDTGQLKNSITVEVKRIK